MKQPSFSDLEHSVKKKTIRKERFLATMDEVIPWQRLLKPLRRKYPKGERGRPPTPLQALLRIYFLQQWFGLSDPGVEDSLYDTLCLRQFAGLSLDNIPDETTICKFRHFLETHNLSAVLFDQVNVYLQEQGLLVHEGSIVDATIISASGSTKNQKQQRDPDMRQTRKGNQWYFGMKAHIGTDLNGRVHSVCMTDAAVHDSQCLDDLLHGDEQIIYGDKAYSNRQRQRELEQQGKTWRVNRKAVRGRKLNCADQSFNRKSNRVRARVEHVFGVIKHQWGYRKVRYRGLEKNANQLFALFALANVYMCRRSLVRA